MNMFVDSKVTYKQTGKHKTATNKYLLSECACVRFMGHVPRMEKKYGERGGGGGGGVKWGGGLAEER